MHFMSSSTIRSSSGCWTCRLRRKKCDERKGICEACAALHITCHYGENKPEWMDGGARQEEMAERIKREVKEKAHYRRKERSVQTSGSHESHAGAAMTGVQMDFQRSESELTTQKHDIYETPLSIRNGTLEPYFEGLTFQVKPGTDCTMTSSGIRQTVAFERSDNVLLMFYLDHLSPFLFPFYQPSPFLGGRAWMLELMVSSPAVRRAILCQSSYFFSLAKGMETAHAMWDTMLNQTSEAFDMLRKALQVINTSSVTEHLHGAVRIMACIMQIQRFEIAVSSFNNSQAHLNAALALFKRLLDASNAGLSATSISSFDAVIRSLGPSSMVLPAQCNQVPNAEQAAFKFSTSLLIFDDIIASTILQQQPELYEYHQILLSSTDGTEPAINLEDTLGCQNWALLSIGEIAALDAWKKRSKESGTLDVMELVHRATVIKTALEAHLAKLEVNLIVIAKQSNGLIDVLTAGYHQHLRPLSAMSSLITSAWAHAALLYLFVVVSGWQPASTDVRYHVNQIIQLFLHRIRPPALLRTMVWPICVAGCLAEPAQESYFRVMVAELQPSVVFGTLSKALEIMSNVWRNRDAADAVDRDLATCFRSQGDLVLLV